MDASIFISGPVIAGQGRPPMVGRQRQSGAILFIGMILLLVLTLLGGTALRSAMLQERMAGNLRERGIAFDAAESALAAASEYLTDPATDKNAAAELKADKSDCDAPGIFKLDATTKLPYFQENSPEGKHWDGSKPSFWDDYPWHQAACVHTDKVQYVTSTEVGKPGKPAYLPRYVIEEIPKGGGATGNAYRVTAIGYGSGRTSGVKVILQATYPE